MTLIADDLCIIITSSRTSSNYYPSPHSCISQSSVDGGDETEREPLLSEHESLLTFLVLYRLFFIFPDNFTNVENFQ